MRQRHCGEAELANEGCCDRSDRAKEMTQWFALLSPGVQSKNLGCSIGANGTISH